MSDLLDEPAIVPSGQVVIPPAATWASAAPKILHALRHPGVRRTLLITVALLIVGALAYFAHRDIVSSVDDSGDDIRADLAVVMTTIGHLSKEQQNIRDRLKGIESGQMDIIRKTAVHDGVVEGLKTRVDSLASVVKQLDDALNSAIWRNRQVSP